MSYIDVTGKTEDEAISNALRQLGLERDEVSVEILERAKSGFLGLGAQPAKIRVTYGPRDEETVSEEQAPEAPAPVEKKPEPVKAEPKKPARPAEKKPERKPEKKQEKKEPAVQAAPAEQPAADLGEEVNDEKAQAIRAFLSGLLEQMETPADIHVYLPEKGRYKVILEGKNLGALIGRRGETLDAIQQLTSYAVNRSGDRRCRIQLDAENYRERREQSLCRLAEKMAEKAVRYRRNVTMEPMNAYERHVIHTALQDTPYVTTYSTGVDPNRRVIIAYDRSKR